MSLSSISSVVIEGLPKELSSFSYGGVPYLLWYSIVGDTGIRKLNWKPQASGNFTEVIPTLVAPFNSISALCDPSSGNLVVVWDDGLSSPGVANGYIYTARFNVATGAILSGPTQLFQGSKPKMCYRSTTPSSEFLLFYRTAKSDGVYGHMSENGGLTWKSGYPLITGQVKSTQYLEVESLDATHVSVTQIGLDSRPLQEISAYQRTRPLSSIVKHPTVAGEFFISEPSKRDTTTLTDSLRGGLVLSTDLSKLYHLDGSRFGTSDSIGVVALLSVSGTTFSLIGSAGPASGVDGDDLVSYTLTPALGSLNYDLPGSGSIAVSMDVSANYVYIAEYADNSSSAGQLTVVSPSGPSSATPLSGVTAVRAVAVANFLVTPLIFVASTESGFERLRVYQENGLTPTLQLNTKLPSRANWLTAAVDPTNPTGVLIYAALVDRMNIYRYTSSSLPLLLVDQITFPGGGSFFQVVLASTGNVVMAAGNAGVVVIGPNGNVVAQSRVSGEVINDWAPGTVYTLGAKVKPRKTHPFSGLRYYFQCSTAGTSGASEPQWTTSATVIDNSAQWQVVGLTDGVVTGIALDATTKRIYAVGVAGGNAGTDGRIWVFNATGLL